MTKGTAALKIAAAKFQNALDKHRSEMNAMMKEPGPSPVVLIAAVPAAR